jgi:WD40 repeat protein
MLKPISRKVVVGMAVITMATVVGLGWSRSLSHSKPLRPSQTNPIAQPDRTLKGHSVWVYAIAISPDRKTLASGSYDGSIKVWDLHTGQLLRTINAHATAVESLAISGNILVSGSWDNRVKLWNLAKGELIRTLPKHSDDVKSVAISSDGKILASASWDKTVKLWNVQTGEEIHTFIHTDAVRAVAISPDGQLLASGTEDGKIAIWQLNTRKLRTPLAAHDKAIFSIAFSSNGNIASGSDEGTIKLWSSHGELLHTLTGHNSAVRSVAFSPDGNIIASGSHDSTIKLWNSRTGQMLATLAGHSKSIWSVAFNPQGNVLASGSADETIKIWQVSKLTSSAVATPSEASISELEAVVQTRPEITNYTQIYALNQKVYGQINQTWLQRSQFRKDLVYRVGVAEDGAILGYKSVNSDVSNSTEQIALKNLLYKLVERRAAKNEATVHFRVVFTTRGILEVSPWQGYRSIN